MEKTDENYEQGENPAGMDESAAAAALLKQREMIEKLESRNKELEAAKATYYDAVINGNQAGKADEPEPPSVKECRDKVLDVVNRGGSNLDYVKAALALNEACEREQGISCFLPQGKDVIPTADEVQSAQRVESVFRECVEIADGDPAVFNNELMRRMKDQPQAGKNNTRR